MTTFILLSAFLLNSFFVTPTTLPEKVNEKKISTKITLEKGKLLPATPLDPQPVNCSADTATITTYSGSCSYTDDCTCSFCKIYSFTVHCSCCIGGIDITSDGNCFFACGQVQHSPAVDWVVNVPKASCDNSSETLLPPQSGDLVCDGETIYIKICSNHRSFHGLHVTFRSIPPFCNPFTIDL